MVHVCTCTDIRVKWFTNIFGHLPTINNSHPIYYGIQNLFYVYCIENILKFHRSTVMRDDCHDYVGKVSSQSESVYRSYKIFIANIRIFQ